MAKAPKKPSLYADAEYEVGKGKPPIHSQFKKGGKSPNPRGRPPESRNRTNFEKALDKKYKVGTDASGRVIMRPLREVITLKMLKRAADGDYAAMKLVIEFDMKFQRMRQDAAPTAETVRAEKAGEREALSATLVDQLAFISDAKFLGIVDNGDDGRLRIAPWAVQAAQERARGGGRETPQDC